MKKLLVLFLALSLTACAGTLPSITNPLTPATIDSVEDAYGAAIAVAVTYKRSCLARLIPKSCYDTLRHIQPYEAKAYKALTIAQDFVKNNPTLNALTVITTARDAVKAFSDEQYINGVK